MHKNIFMVLCLTIVLACNTKNATIPQASTSVEQVDEIDKKRTYLEYIQGLIKNGEHRKGLELLSDFRENETDNDFLILAGMLEDDTLDSLYSE